MLSVINAIQPMAGKVRRFVAARSSAKGLGTNSSHIGWGIGAVVIVGGLLAALHSVWMPWLNGVFGNVTSLSTNTTTTP
jgi:hypothetical protein